jgi:hypothetical protein
VRYPGDVLYYSPFAHEPDMNAFFGLIGPEKYKDAGATPKDEADFDVNKAADGRHTIKSIVTGCEEDEIGNCIGTNGYYTGGPFYGPFGITGLENSRDDDVADREALVNEHFVKAVEDAEGDKFESEHQFAAYGKALCLSCHQRSSLAINPESNGIPGTQVGDDQFLELCSTWSAMSDGVGNNFEDTETSPKCQRCHMEPLTTIEGRDAVVLHKWDDYPNLFTTLDTALTHHFLPPEGEGWEGEVGDEGPVAEGYLNNHAFMGANKADFGTIKIESGFESGMKVKAKNRNKIEIETYLMNKTAHMFPGAHPMRRVLTRMVVTDADGNKLSFNKAKGKSKFEDVTNELAVLDGNEIMPDFDTVEVKYEKGSDVEIQGMSRDLRNEHVSSQFMDDTVLDWVSPDGTVINSEPVCTIDPDTGECIWAIKGTTTVKKITDIKGPAENFTRIYGRETGKRAPDGTHVVRPGFDSNIAADNRLKPNETEKYRVTYNTKKAARPLTVDYKVYYLKKGGSGVFEALTAEDGFLKERSDFPEGDDGDLAWAAYSAKLKKAAIYEVYSQDKIIK